MDVRLELKLAQKLIMTPQLQQAIKLLQLSRLELVQSVSQELMENPVLEELAADAPDTDASESEGEALPETAEAAPEAEGDRTAEETKELAAEPEMGLQWDEYLSDMGDGRDQGYAGADEKELPSYEQTLSRRASLSEHLLWQLRLTASDETHLKGAEWIIGNIDEDGYLRASLDELAEQAGLPLAVMEQALAVVQLFDPVGVGSRDLRECLLIQARELDFEETLVELIIRDHLADLEKKRYAQIAKVLNVTLQDVMEASQIIIHEFEPKPGIPYADPDTHYVVPDIYVVKVEDRYVVQLNEDGVPRVRINPYYRKLLTRKDAVDKATRDYIEERMRSAQWLMKGMDQRNKTIYKVAESIVKFQFDFLENGISHLKPMVLKDVAEDISMHESTISRVTTSKYMHSPQGLFPMKFFFTTGFSAGGEGDISSLTVKAAIQKMIKEEDPSSPLKDQQIVDALKERSITIARRTVAKYREELRIPPTSVRKRM
ncbi:MAG: RNA polymerase sigma-54 factor [Nitrospirae bacterium GWC2_57_13]|jgi:RNA polymerase sigma-54 factor|nr:MAG: RNA polymerase sigma-54 factor [Nitrospirae bacterium GWC2_57_13]